MLYRPKQRKLLKISPWKTRNDEEHCVQLDEKYFIKHTMCVMTHTHIFAVDSMAQKSIEKYVSIVPQFCRKGDSTHLCDIVFIIYSAMKMFELSRIAQEKNRFDKNGSKYLIKATQTTRQ